MKHWLNRLIVLIAGDSEEFDLEHRNLNGTCFIATIGAIPTLVINSVVPFSIVYNITAIFTCIFFFTFYYLSRIKKKSKYINSLFLIISIVCLSIIWLFSQGIEGSATFIFYDLLFISLIIFRTRRYLFVLSFYFLSLGVFLFLQFKYPALIVPYISKQAQILDLSSSFVICILIFSYLVTTLKKNYENERDKVQKQKIEIEKQNTEIQEKNAELEEKQEEINAQKDQLEKINHELIEADEIKSRFFANISHEFRTPLSLIIDPLQTLRDKTADVNLKNEYSLMLKHSERLLLLINQLLDLSKIEKGKMQLVLQETDISAYIRAIVASFTSVANERKIHFHLEETDKEIHGFIDVDKLEKISYNILSNAFKFTADGGNIEVVVRKSGDGNNLEIVVKDTGIGINSEKLPYIFDRFYQVDGARNRAYEGSGIGLALTKELVTMHNGTIEVSSVPNEGSIFIVVLPLEKAAYIGENIVFAPYKSLESPTIHELKNLNYQTQSKHQSQEKLAKTKKTILVVEDNIDMRNHLVNNLSEEYKVEQAMNGEEGIKKALEIQPDLILSDVMMPVTDGFQLTLSLKNNPLTCHIPIVLLTAKAGDNNKMEGFQIHADDYITKPFTIKDIMARVSSLIANREKLKSKFIRTLTVEPSEITTTSMDEQFIRQVLEIIELNMTNSFFSVDDLCREMSMSRTTIHLKLKAITNQSTTEFIRSVRLKRAAQLIKQKAGNISDIAYMTGFTTVQYFSRSFKEHFNVSPSEY